MKKVKDFFNRLWKEESAQGATEYILLLVVVVAVVMLFRTQIQNAVQSKLDSLSNDISTFTGSN